MQKTPPEKSFVVFFDCDGTLTGAEGSWPAIHDALGTNEFREKELNRYLDDEQTYREWTIRTAREWEGRDASTVREAFDSIELTAGLRETVRSLHDLGAIVGIVSAGVGQFVELVGEEGGFDFVVANELGVDQGTFDGTVDIQVTDESKSEVYGNIIEELGVDIENAVVIGDSIHDVHKLHPNNLSIAYDPNDDQTAEEADVSIFDDDLTLTLTPIREWVDDSLVNQ